MPLPSTSPSKMESVEKFSTPSSEKSWADVVDSTVSPVGPPQEPSRRNSVSVPLPQRQTPSSLAVISIVMNAIWINLVEMFSQLII